MPAGMGKLLHINCGFVTFVILFRRNIPWVETNVYEDGRSVGTIGVFA
ncbi:MAG: hypothetical protein JWQ30_257 [Sediminibacterium sp.]|nr:hypothetical protein [Sediminibacterium sp.]